MIMKEKLTQLIHATTKKSKLPVRIFLSAFGVFMMGFGMSVIEKLGFGEEQAQHFVEKQSMDQRITKRQAAENIIRSCGKSD